MGSKAPKTTVVPQAKTDVYQTVIPQEDFDKADRYVAALNEQTFGPGGIRDNIYKIAGTPKEISDRMSGYRARENASYAASVAPGMISDRFVPITSPTDPRNVLSETANKISEDSRKDYSEAVQKVEEAKSNPTPASTPTPEPQRQPEPWRQPEQELKEAPRGYITMPGQGQTHQTFGNGETLNAMLRHAQKNNKGLGDVSWEDIGYKDPGQKYRLPI